jgi:phosphoglucosamine mutase
VGTQRGAAMSRKFFGTDGIRGRVGKPPITPDFALKLAYAAGKVLSRADVAPPHRDGPRCSSARTRASPATCSRPPWSRGSRRRGVDTYLVGPMPHAGGRVPHAGAAPFRRRDDLRLAQPLRGQRHQVLLRGRHEAPDAVESEHRGAARAAAGTAFHFRQLGKAERVHDAEGRYLEFCKGNFPRT